MPSDYLTLDQTLKRLTATQLVIASQDVVGSGDHFVWCLSFHVTTKRNKRGDENPHAETWLRVMLEILPLDVIETQVPVEYQSPILSESLSCFHAESMGPEFVREQVSNLVQAILEKPQTVCMEYKHDA